MSRIEKTPTGPFSPFYGCAIMVMATMVFGGIIGWSIYSLLTQDKAIAKITVDDPIQLPVTELTPEARTNLEQRLTTFAQAARNGQPAELTLSLTEINALLTLAPDTGYGSYTNMVHFEATYPEKEALHARICLPMNRLKFWEDKKRYLIGNAAFYIYVHEEGIDAKVVDVKVPGKEVPEGFITGIEIWPWVAPYRKIEPLGTVLKAIRQVKVTPEGVVLSTATP